MHVTPEQIHAARALLRLDQAELASRASVSIVTIRELEGSPGPEPVQPGTVDTIRQALEQAGAEFIPNGVRRRPTVRPDAEERIRRLRAIMLQRNPGEESTHPQWTEADLYDENGLPA